VTPDSPMKAPGRITVRANGADYGAAFGISLADFIKERGLNPARVVVERNGEALSPGEHKSVVLSDGDRMEIVKIVAGG
jgi:thiamine biosynthesis protein ThiS